MKGEEVQWLRRCEMLCGDLDIDIAMMKECFETRVWNKTTHTHQAYVRNFVGRHWISDSEMDRLLDVTNRQYSDTICFAAKPNKLLCAFSQIQTNLESALGCGTRIKRILVAVHVGSEGNGKTCVSNGSKQGNHWCLLIIDLENKGAHYGILWDATYLTISSLPWRKILLC